MMEEGATAKKWLPRAGKGQEADTLQSSLMAPVTQTLRPVTLISATVLQFGTAAIGN